MSDLVILSNQSGNLAINYKYVNPTGSIICFAGQSPPPGWSLCNGAEVSKAVYSDLYAVISNNYGTAANPTANFLLPDLRQRMPVGKSTDNSNTLGATGGSSSAILTTDHLPSHTHTGTTNSAGQHTHTVTDPGHTHTYTDAYFAENRSGGTNAYGTSASTDNDNDYIFRPTPTTNTGYTNISLANNGAHTHAFTTDATGSGSSINIMNPFLVLNYLIKH